MQKLAISNSVAKKKIIPVVLHNLRGYGSHLLMQRVSKFKGEVTYIPNNTEKYISFSIWQLRFIDSTQFLLGSLDKLVSSSPQKTFKIIGQYEPDREKRQLLMRNASIHMSTWIHGTASMRYFSHRKRYSTAS